MKNDRKYIYLKVADYSHYHTLSMIPEREENTFGPFRRKQLIQSFMDNITRLFPVVQKNNSFEFNYHTLPEKMRPTAFIKNRRALMKIFSEHTSMECLINRLQLCMNKEAAQYNYERATKYRDLIKSLTYISHVLYDYKSLTS